MSNITRDAREGKVEVRGIFMGGGWGWGGWLLNPVWAFD